MQPRINIIWFRRDLRLNDNAALYHALKSKNPILPIFIFDKHILDQLDDKDDKRVAFIHNALHAMQQQLAALNSNLEVHYGYPLDVFNTLLKKYTIVTVYANHDDELYALQRDSAIQQLLNNNAANLKTFKDHVIFEKSEVTKDDGLPYTIFTPYSRKWKAALKSFHLKAYPTEKYFNNFFQQTQQSILSLESMGFKTQS